MSDRALRAFTGRWQFPPAMDALGTAECGICQDRPDPGQRKAAAGRSAPRPSMGAPEILVRIGIGDRLHALLVSEAVPIAMPAEQRTDGEEDEW